MTKVIDYAAIVVALLLATGLDAPKGYSITGNIAGLIICLGWLLTRMIYVRRFKR